MDLLSFRIKPYLASNGGNSQFQSPHFPPPSPPLGPTFVPPAMNSGGRGGKRRGPPPLAPSGAAAKRVNPSPGTPHVPPPASAAAAGEEDMMDEDVFLDESILAEDEAALLMLQRDEALASRLARWKRPAIPTDLAAGCSRTVGMTRFPFSLPALTLLIRVFMDSVFRDVFVGV